MLCFVDLAGVINMELLVKDAVCGSSHLSLRFVFVEDGSLFFMASWRCELGTFLAFSGWVGIEITFFARYAFWLVWLGFMTFRTFSTFPRFFFRDRSFSTFDALKGTAEGRSFYSDARDGNLSQRFNPVIYFHILVLCIPVGGNNFRCIAWLNRELDQMSSFFQFESALAWFLDTKATRINVFLGRDFQDFITVNKDEESLSFTQSVGLILNG